MAAGARLPPDRRLDGIDLLPYLRGQRDDAPHPALFWGWRGQWAVRAGSLKLVHARDGNLDEPSTGLFDLSADVAESRDLSASRPQVVADLRRRLRAWERALAGDG